MSRLFHLSFDLTLYRITNLCRCTVTAVDAEIGTSHPSTSIGEHVYGGPLEVLGGAKTAEKGTTHPGVLQVGLLLKQSVCHSSANILKGRGSAGSCQANQNMKDFLPLLTVCSRECYAGPILERPICTFGVQQLWRSCMRCKSIPTQDLRISL